MIFCNREKKDAETLNFFGALKFINQFLDKLHIQLVLFYLGWLFDTVASILSPILFGIMINQMVYYRNLSLFIQIGIIFFGLSVFSCIQYFLLYEMYGHVWNELIYRVRCKMYSIVQKIDAKSMANSDYGDMSQLIQWQVMECVHFIVRNVVHNINNYINIVICLIISYIISPLIALVLFIMVPISVFISYRFGKKIRVENDRNQKAYGKYISWLYEVFNALKDIRLLGAEKHVNDIFHKHQNTLIKTDIKAGIATLKAEHIIANTGTLLQMALYTVLALLASHNGLSIGSVIVILAYFESLTDSLELVSERYMDAQFRISVIQRIKNLMEQPLADNKENKNTLTVPHGEINFKNLSFSYNEKKTVINNLNLQIRSGEKVAVIGESGCGKSTLCYMMLGFYEPNEGCIEIDGQKLSECSLYSIRDNIGVVQQEVLIFDGTVRHNIMLGNQNASDWDLINACKAAGIYDFIMELDNQFETILGRNGRQLSGGQKQRIAIARIYLKNPPIIIFDEATASLDNETEAQIHKAWRQVLKGRTAIVIAHRQSSVMLCDRAALLSEGKIIESGTPNELEDRCPDFRRLFAVGKEVFN